MVFVATAAILSSLPGALITLASRPLYPIHTEGVSAWGLTLLQDQQLAGLVMWIPGGFAFLAALAFVFVKWLQHSDGERVGFVTRVASPAILLLRAAIAARQLQRRPPAKRSSRREAPTRRELNPLLWLRLLPCRPRHR
jgi:cytochrome c oxidase assembly factor CtaG